MTQITQTFHVEDSWVEGKAEMANTTWHPTTIFNLDPQWKCKVHGAHFETIAVQNDTAHGTCTGPEKQVFCIRCIALLFSSAKVGVMEKV